MIAEPSKAPTFTTTPVSYNAMAQSVLLAVLNNEPLLRGAKEDAERIGLPMEQAITRHTLAITDAFFTGLAGKLTIHTAPAKE